jgi:hypothetical protein
MIDCSENGNCYVIKGNINRKKYAGAWLQPTVDITNPDKMVLLCLVHRKLKL